MKMIEQDDVRKALEVLQPGLVLLVQLDCAPDALGACRLNGHAFQFCIRGMDDANGGE